MEEDPPSALEFDLDHLEDYPLEVLRTFCREEKLIVRFGNRKEDLIRAIRAYAAEEDILEEGGEEEPEKKQRGRKRKKENEQPDKPNDVEDEAEEKNKQIEKDEKGKEKV